MKNELNKYPGVFYHVFDALGGTYGIIEFSGRRGNYEHLNKQKLLIVEEKFRTPIEEIFDDWEAVYDAGIWLMTDYWKELEGVDFDIYPGNTTVYLKESGFDDIRYAFLPDKYKTADYVVRYRLCKTSVFNDDNWNVQRTDQFFTIAELNEKYGFELKDIYHEYNEDKKPEQRDDDDLPF